MSVKSILLALALTCCLAACKKNTDVDYTSQYAGVYGVRGIEADWTIDHHGDSSWPAKDTLLYVTFESKNSMRVLLQPDWESASLIYSKSDSTKNVFEYYYSDGRQSVWGAGTEAQNIWFYKKSDSIQFYLGGGNALRGHLKTLYGIRIR